MPKFIICWDAGYGESIVEVEADDCDEAMEMAEDSWREEIESNACYDVIGEATDELREKYGL